MNAAGPDARFAHDAGKTGENLASRQEKGTGEQRGNRGKREGNADGHKYIRTYADQGQTA